jgi:hypothetical protein
MSFREAPRRRPQSERDRGLPDRLLRIYEHGEFGPDAPEAIARRAGYKTRGN